jgi:hypothetical protein
MPSCALTQDYNITCEPGIGGNKFFWIIESENVTDVVESSGTVTAITRTPGKIFRKYQLALETANTDEKLNSNVQNGTMYFTQTASLVINKQQVSVRNEILIIARNSLMLIAEDNTGAYRLYGRNNGLRVTDGGAASGTAWADRNGYTLTFSGNEKELAPFIDPAVIETLQTT